MLHGTEDDLETGSDSETPIQKLAILKLQSDPIQKLADSENGRFRNYPIQELGDGVGGWGGGVGI